MDAIKTKEIKRQYKHFLGINLSDKQAEKVITYEFWLDADAGSNTYMSPWEEDEFELSFFEKLLRKDQFKTYNRNAAKRVNKRIAELKEADAVAAAEAYEKTELAKNFKTDFFPRFLKFQPWLQLNVSDAVAKLQFIKSEYKLYLDRQYKSGLIHHYRLSRMYQPNILLERLRGENSRRLFPDYSNFRKSMDEETLQVALLLERKLDKVLPQRLEDIRSLYKELDDVFDRQIKALLAKMEPALVFGFAPPTEKERLMQILLIDPEFYEYDKPGLF